MQGPSSRRRAWGRSPGGREAARLTPGSALGAAGTAERTRSAAIWGRVIPARSGGSDISSSTQLSNESCSLGLAWIKKKIKEEIREPFYRGEGVSQTPWGGCLKPRGGGVSNPVGGCLKPRGEVSQTPWVRSALFVDNFDLGKMPVLTPTWRAFDMN